MPEFHLGRPNISKNAVIILVIIALFLYYFICLVLTLWPLYLFYSSFIYFIILVYLLVFLYFVIFLVFILLFVDIFNYSCIYYIILQYFFLYLFFYSCTYLFVIFPGILQIVIRTKKKTFPIWISICSKMMITIRVVCCLLTLPTNYYVFHGHGTLFFADYFSMSDHHEIFTQLF